MIIRVNNYMLGKLKQRFNDCIESIERIDKTHAVITIGKDCSDCIRFLKKKGLIK